MRTGRQFVAHEERSRASARPVDARSSPPSDQTGTLVRQASASAAPEGKGGARAASGWSSGALVAALTSPVRLFLWALRSRFELRHVLEANVSSALLCALLSVLVTPATVSFGGDAVAGVLVLTGIAYGAASDALAGATAALASALAAVASLRGLLSGYSTSQMTLFDVRPGSHQSLSEVSFNGFLTGIAMSRLVDHGGATAPTSVIVLAAVAGVLTLTIVLPFQGLKGLPPATYPFNIAQFFLAAALWNFGGVESTQTSTAVLAEVIAREDSCVGDWGDMWRAVLRGVGQIYFQSDDTASALILAGVAWDDARIALALLAGSAMGAATAAAAGVRCAEITQGLWGYNAALCVAWAVFQLFVQADPSDENAPRRRGGAAAWHASALLEQTADGGVLALPAWSRWRRRRTRLWGVAFVSALTVVWATVFHGALGAAFAHFDGRRGTLAFCFSISIANRYLQHRPELTAKSAEEGDGASDGESLSDAESGARDAPGKRAARSRRRKRAPMRANAKPQHQLAALSRLGTLTAADLAGSAKAARGEGAALRRGNSALASLAATALAVAGEENV